MVSTLIKVNTLANPATFHCCWLGREGHELDAGQRRWQRRWKRRFLTIQTHTSINHGGRCFSYGRHAPPPPQHRHRRIQQSENTLCNRLRMMVAGCDGRTADAERCRQHWRHIVNVLAGTGLFSFTALVNKLDKTARGGSSHHWRYRVRLGPSLDRRVLESAL
jgi:hypothetical protein